MRRRALWLANLLLPKHREPLGRLHAMHLLVHSSGPEVKRYIPVPEENWYRPLRTPVNLSAIVETESGYEFAD